MVAGMWLAVSKACQHAGFWEGWQTQDQCTRNGVIRQVTEQTVGQRGGKAALVPKYWVGGDAIVSLQVITHACVLSPYLVSKVVSFIRAGPVVISLRIQHLKQFILCEETFRCLLIKERKHNGILLHLSRCKIHKQFILFAMYLISTASSCLHFSKAMQFPCGMAQLFRSDQSVLCFLNWCCAPW